MSETQTQPQDPKTRPWLEKIRDEPIRWTQFSKQEIVEAIEAAYLYGDTNLLAKARAALRRREADTRPYGETGWNA